MQQHFIPPDATVAELERKAADAEEKATGGTAARAGILRHQVATASAKADAARACATGRSCAGCNGTRLLPEPVNVNCR